MIFFKLHTRPLRQCLKSWRTLIKHRNVSYLHNPGSEPLRPLTLGKLLEQTCKTHGDVAAIISRHQKQTLTYHEVLDQADHLATGLRAIGLNQGDRVGIWAPNFIEWYVVCMACARGGYILVNINPAYQAREIAFCINKVGVKSIICAHKFKSQNYYEILNTVAPEIGESDPMKISSKNLPSLKNLIVLSNEELRGCYKYKDIFGLANKDQIVSLRKNQDYIQMDDPCHIQFTSGTTGEPKAAYVSHFSIVNNSYFLGKRTELNRKQHKICVQVPLFHAFGTVITIAAALNHGSTLVLPSASYGPEKSLDAIKDEKCTVIHGTPTMYVDLVEKQKQRNEKIYPEIALVAGACCSPHLLREMKEVLNLKKIKQAYGLTEATAIVFQSMHDDNEDLSTSTVGFVQEHVEAKVVDAEGQIVPWGTPGELCLRGYFTMMGYWQDKERTRETMGDDRWLKTGDQFILRPNGYGQIVGRLKEMIIRGGENIFPKEIEDFLSTHEDILEVHVIGLPHERLGEEVCACVRIKENISVTLEDIKYFCKGKIAHYKIPSVMKIVELFPKTTSGKIQKYKLLEIVNSEK